MIAVFRASTPDIGDRRDNIDRVRIGDQTFNEGEKRILAVDQMVLRTIAGETLDVENINGRTELVLLSN